MYSTWFWVVFGYSVHKFSSSSHMETRKMFGCAVMLHHSNIKSFKYKDRRKDNVTWQVGCLF